MGVISYISSYILYCVLSHLGMEVILLSHLGHGDYLCLSMCTNTVCRAICAWSIGGDLSLSICIVCRAIWVWTSSVAQYCILSNFFGHRGDRLAFVVCVKAGLIWHGLQSSEEMVRGLAL